MSYRSFRSTASSSTLAALFAGFAASSGSGAVSTASASTFTVQRKGIRRDTEVTSSSPSVTAKLPLTCLPAGTLVLEGQPLPQLRCLQIVAARLRLAEAVGARVDLDGALQPGAGGEHLAVRVGGGCEREEQRGEHRAIDERHVPSSSGCSGEPSTRNATASSGGHGGCARARRVSGQRILRSRRHPEAGAVEKLPAPRARGP